MTGRCANTRHMTSRSFTLIELLAVIVIISLTTGIAVVSIATTSESAQLHATVARWRDLDARARIFARSLGPVTMRLKRESQALQLRQDSSGELLAQLHLPEDLGLHLTSEDPSHAIVFDRLGHSPDYDVKLLTRNRTIHWHVCGLTGCITELHP